MTNKTDGERLERVEANLETLTGLVEEQGKTLKDIRDAQLISTGTNASKEYVDSKVDTAKNVLTLEITNAKRKNTALVWLTSTMAAVFGAILSLLVAYFINTVGR